MITQNDALTASTFHEDHEPAGKICTWRRNGQTQTWITRPDDFRIPVEYGLRSYGQITQADADRYHAASACPTRHVRVSGPEHIGEFTGIVIDEPVPNNAGYGVTRVHVTTRGTSRNRVGSLVSIATKHLTYL